MRRNANGASTSSSNARDLDLDLERNAGGKPRVKGGVPLSTLSKGPRQKRWWKLTCSVLCVVVVFALVVAAVKIKPLADSYGYEVPYYLVAPYWLRWLTEPSPLVITPARVLDPDAPPVEGAEKVGEFWVSRVATHPNLTIVHNFMSEEDCAFLRSLAAEMGLLPANTFKVGNGDGGGAVTLNSLLDAIYDIVRTSKGEFIELKTITPEQLQRVLGIMRRAETITGMHLGNFEPPFLQFYEPNNVFRAHYDMYQIDMAKPFPYHDNQRSATLLAYLADTERGGETEFMLAEPRPVIIKPRAGVAVIWSNCVLEDRPASDAWEPAYDRCRGGAGPHGYVGDQVRPKAGERVQQPCCVARDYNSIHQSRPVARGSTKWTMTIWIRQRFTLYADTYADTYGYRSADGGRGDD